MLTAWLNTNAAPPMAKHLNELLKRDERKASTRTPPVTVYFGAFWPVLEFNDRIGCIGLIGCSADKLAEITAWTDSSNTMQAGS
jgi:hypothetical protein